MGGILGTCTVQAETRDKRGSREALPHVRLATCTHTHTQSLTHTRTHTHSHPYKHKHTGWAGLAVLVDGPGSHFRRSVPPVLSCLCGLDLVWSGPWSGAWWCASSFFFDATARGWRERTSRAAVTHVQAATWSAQSGIPRRGQPRAVIIELSGPRCDSRVRLRLGFGARRQGTRENYRKCHTPQTAEQTESMTQHDTTRHEPTRSGRSLCPCTNMRSRRLLFWSCPLHTHTSAYAHTRSNPDSMTVAITPPRETLATDKCAYASTGHGAKPSCGSGGGGVGCGCPSERLMRPAPLACL